MGPVLVKTLYELGLLKNGSDFYSLTYDDIRKALKIVRGRKRESIRSNHR